MRPGRHRVAGHRRQGSPPGARQVQKDHRPGRGGVGPSADWTARLSSPVTADDPALRRAEHVRAAARRPREAPRRGVRRGLRRSGPRVPAPGRPRPRPARARRVRRRAGPARSDRPRARGRDATARTSSTRSIRCCHRPRRDPAPSRASRTAPASPPILEAWTGAPGSRPPAASRRPARSRAATRSGCGPTCSASGGRCGRTTRARASSPRSSAATCGSSMCRTGAARPS